MKDKNKLNRMTAAAKAFEKILQAQNEQKLRQLVEEVDSEDDIDLITDMLAEISDLLYKAADLTSQVSDIISGSDIEVECYGPYYLPY